MSLMNRLYNSKNLYQTQAKRVLAVCSAGLLRSPTVANVLHAEYGYNTRAAGTVEEFALIPVDAVLLDWADEVVYVEPAVYRLLSNHHVLGSTVLTKRNVLLNIPDQFAWNDPELRNLILKQYQEATKENEQSD